MYVVLGISIRTHSTTRRAPQRMTHKGSDISCQRPLNRSSCGPTMHSRKQWSSLHQTAQINGLFHVA